jgi:hypothetical protein
MRNTSNYLQTPKSKPSNKPKEEFIVQINIANKNEAN